MDECTPALHADYMHSLNCRHFWGLQRGLVFTHTYPVVRGFLPPDALQTGSHVGTLELLLALRHQHRVRASVRNDGTVKFALTISGISQLPETVNAQLISATTGKVEKCQGR